MLCCGRVSARGVRMRDGCAPQAELDGLQRQHTQTKTLAEQASGALATLHSQTAALQGEHSDLLEQKELTSAEHAAAATELDALKQKGQEAASERERLKIEHDAAKAECEKMEEALKGFAEFAEEHDAARAENEELKACDSCICTFYPPPHAPP